MRLNIVLLAVAVVAHGAKLRVLFVGNSFTFVYDLPGQLENIARSLGDEVEAKSSTIGGCTLYFQQAGSDQKSAEFLQEEWDYIVLQDYSLLPTVKKARELYMIPAIEDFIGRKGDAKVVLYLTWGYNNGVNETCPPSDNTECFPLGTLANLTEPACDSNSLYQQSVRSFECMGYSLARGYFAAKEAADADLVAPCGLAWQAVRDSQAIPAECQAAIDAEYSGALPLELPLRVEGGAAPDLMLYIRQTDGAINKHPNVHGSYLNALVFYATLFGKSPVGAAPPAAINSSSNISEIPPAPLSDAELLALQTAAAGSVAQCGPACGLLGSDRIVFA